MIKSIIQRIRERREQKMSQDIMQRIAGLQRARQVELFGENADELVIKFFEGENDVRIPHSIEEVINYTDDDMELNHDFIQWIYPTIKPSQFHPNSPFISEHFGDLLALHPTACSNYCRSCRRYLAYLNFECVGSGDIRLRADSDACEKAHEKDFYNLPGHNYLRITRALESLRDTGHPYCSNRLYAALLRSLRFAPKHWVSKETLEYWETTQKRE